MTTKTLNPEQMEARVARFGKLQTYQSKISPRKAFRPAQWRRSRPGKSIR